MQRGFSLLELSIVLVIIGLITGGIMAGQNMVRAAELRSVMSDLRKYEAAIYTFREKYSAFPGDMKNAVAYWGAAAGGTANGVDTTCQAYTSPSTGTATCNGDGNGLVGLTSEYFRTWQHLANAGLIEGQYSGVTGPGNATYDAVPGVNVPAGKITGSGYFIQYSPIQSGSTWYFDGVFGGNYILVGTDAGTASVVQGPIFTGAEAFMIDTKLDDGLPGMGRITTWKGGYSSQSSGISCATTSVPSTSVYDVTQSIKACPLWYMLN